MSKELELTVYPYRETEWPAGYLVPKTMTSGAVLDVIHMTETVDKRAKAKRLTDAELAAECHAATLAVYRAKVHQEEPRLEQMVIVRRFALLPHYDEAGK
ncbi:hypothetical protein [Arthrobacter sp. efr-133-TYG-118]|uniref:hypothetical protein n=1 Tax=Arthrobacter sp. efr-133-TYG-118 TaxID=3040279 RepID=UPI00254B3C79|nr:hypothetical protein [Arthrobacter sp. efr-133-TYG-118]